LSLLLILGVFNLKSKIAPKVNVPSSTKSITDSTSLNSPQSNRINTSKEKCSSKIKEKDCKNLPDCIWDKSTKSCFQDPKGISVVAMGMSKPKP